jgi:hypothetical protein
MAAARRFVEARRVTRFRRSFVWVVIGLLVFMLVATLVLDGAG